MLVELLQHFKSQEYGKTDSICHVQIESRRLAACHDWINGCTG